MKRRGQNSEEKQWVSTREGDETNSWFSTLRHSWRTALRIDRSQLTAVQAIRSTFGFVLPLAVGVATGHVVEGVSMAGGAASLGSVGLSYTYHARTRTMLLACVGIAFSAFVGSVTSRIDWLAVLVAGIWGVGAGLLVSISPPAMIIGLQSVIALIILSHFMLDPLHAAIQAALMFAGALLQVGLALISFPLQGTTPEREALSTLYRTLADYATDPANEQLGPQIRDKLLKAHEILSGSDMQSQKGMVFARLLEEAERIRLSIIILAHLQRQREGNSGDTAIQANSDMYLNQIKQATASELRTIAEGLQSTHALADSSKPLQQIKLSLSALRRQETPSSDEEILRQTLIHLRALRGRLYAAQKLAGSWKNPPQYLPVQAYLSQKGPFRLHDASAILRANLTPRSTTFRHAIRLGFTLALATALYRLIPLPIEHGYWIPLTALLVLKPDFTTTFARGAGRLLGTMLGAVLTTLLISLLAPTQEFLVILAALMAYLAFSVLFVNYAIFSVFITMETVFLLTFITPQPQMIAAYRAIDTVIGGILALLIYALWPTWELSQVPDNLADRLEAVRHYFTAVMDAYANPGTYNNLTFQNLRMQSRLARSNARASIDRSLHEPESHRINPNLALGIMGAIDQVAQSVLTLEAYLLDNPSHRAHPEIIPFSRKVGETLDELATTIREKQPEPVPANIQESFRSLEHTVKAEKQASPEEHWDRRFLLSEAKRIMRSTNTLSQLLLSQ